MKPVDFLTRAVIAAKEAGHIWPEYAAAEAALESGWGESKLAKEANNLFGSKQHKHPDHGTLSLPTKEFENPGQDFDGDGIKGEGWVVCSADWEKFDSWTESFAARMDTLRRLAPFYPHYAAALAAETGEKFVDEVSKTWSTGPQRGAQCLATYRAHFKNGVIV